jgi:DNA replication protein DnaC
MSMQPSMIDSIRKSLVGLRMPRALEALDATLRRIEQGEIDGIQAFDELLVEELTLRESRRIKAVLMMARLTTIKTLAGFDFAFQPSLDKNRIIALAELKFIERAEVVHLLGPPGTGKSHLATALAVEAVKAGKSVYFSTLADIIASLAKAEREGQLRERIRYLCRASLLVVDEIGYLPVVPGGGNLFFQLVNARYERRHDPHLQSRLCRMGRGLWRSRRRNRAARQAASPCRRRSDRGIQLSAAPTCRSCAGARSLQSAHQSAAAEKARPPSRSENQRSRPRLITEIFTRQPGKIGCPHSRKLRCPLTCGGFG